MDDRVGKRWVWAGLGLFTLIFSVVCAWKYGLFAYNGIDLAYFNQVFWNTVQGRPFVQSIHPHLSLGDHAEFAILALAPLYALFPDPRTLLVLQAAVLALPALAVYLIARDRLTNGPRTTRQYAPLLLAAAWLFHPAVQNMALFEFHILPFAILPLFFALRAYDRSRRVAFVLWLLLALIVREDVALVVATIGILAWMERRSWWWRIVPLAVGASWFAAAMAVIRVFSPGGGYKFSIYYAWLGATPAEMFVNALSHPLRVAAHVATLANLEMFIGFMMPLLFLPLLRPKRLILALAPLAQMLLGAPGGGEIVLQTHYATLFMGALFLAAIDGFAALPEFLGKLRLPFTSDERLRLSFAFTAIAFLYCAATLGPLPAAVREASAFDGPEERAATARRLLRSIPEDASVAAGYGLLPPLSSRREVYSLHYLFLGVTQFGGSTYETPAGLRYLAVDQEDLIAYRTQFLETAWSKPRYPGGMDRLERLGGGADFVDWPFVLLDLRKTPSAAALPSERPENQLFAEGISVEAADASVERNEGGVPVLKVGVRWAFARPIDEGAATVRLSLEDPTGEIRGEWIMPLDGIPPTAEEIDRGTLTWASIPLYRLPPGDYRVAVVLEKENADYLMGGIRNAVLRAAERETIGRAELPPVTVR